MKPILTLAMTGCLAMALLAAQSRAPADLYQEALRLEEIKGDLNSAIEQYKKLADSRDRAIAAKALVRMAECYEKLGQSDARKTYERVVRDFADQSESVSAARTRLAALQSPRLPQPGQVSRQMWAGNGANQYASVSPDGRYITYVRMGVGVPSDISVRDLITGTNRVLAPIADRALIIDPATGKAAGDQDAEYSAVSPDGRQIAYTWAVSLTAPNQAWTELRIRTVNSREADQPRIVLRTAVGPTYSTVKLFGWTPDGKDLLTVRKLMDNTWQIAFISTADGSIRVVRSLGWREPTRASLSPDARYIAYDMPAGDRGSARDVFLVAADGSREAAVVDHPADDGRPVWSADGSQILFVSDRTGKSALWTVPIDGGRPKGPALLVKEELGEIVPIGMTRSGVLYYVRQPQPRRNVYVAELDASLNVTGAPSLATDRFTNSTAMPAWSRDGQYLAYIPVLPPLQRSGGMGAESVLVIRTLRTGEERDNRLSVSVAAQSFGAGLEWFPDGRSLLVVARDVQQGQIGFHRVDVTTGHAEVLCLTKTANVGFDLSPDGRTIYYIEQDSTEPRSSRLVRFDLESGRVTELRRGRLNVLAVAVSPDGAQVGYVVMNPDGRHVEIEVMSAVGGEPRVVSLGRFGNEDLRDLTGLAWTPDQRSLLFVRQGRPFSPSLWRVAATGGEPQNMGISTGYPRVHPDGRGIAFERVEDIWPSELWTLENFLPKAGAAR